MPRASKSSLIVEINAAAKVMGVEGSYTIRTSRSKYDWPITVEGHKERSPLYEEASRDFVAYLEDQPGWEMVEADRSGIYLKKAGITVRFY